MRIAIVTDYLSALRGGSECYLFSLVARLVAAGHDVHVFHDRPGDRIEGAKYHPVPVPAYPRFLREWSFGRRVDRRVGHLSPDAIFTVRPLSSATHYRLSNGIYVRCYDAEAEAFDIFWQRSICRTAVRVNPKRQLLIRAQRHVFTKTNAPRLLTNSRLTCSQLREEFGAGLDVTVLYSGVDLGLFRPEADCGQCGPGAKLGRLLFVGHDFSRKGLPCVMAALASSQCAGLDWTLRVVGDGPIPRFRKLAATLGISSRVDFLGGVPRVRMPELYRSSSVLVLPTFYDPCSLAALESMACGCPVITTRRNGASEIIESGRKKGLVIDHPRDLEGLAAAIRLASRPDVLIEMGREAAATARERLDLNDHVKALTRWLER